MKKSGTLSTLASVGVAVTLLVYAHSEGLPPYNRAVTETVTTVNETETLTESIYRVKGNSFTPIDRALEGHDIDIPNDGNAYDEGTTYRVGVDGNGDVTTIVQTESDNY